MGNCSRKHQGVFCFSASSLDDEANAYRGDVNPESPHYLRWRHHRRVVAKILGSSAVSALKRSNRKRKESRQPSSQKGSDSTDDDDRKTASILSTSVSSNSSFFSIASSPSFRSTPDATEQKPQRKQAPQPVGPELRKTPSGGPVSTSDSGIAIFLLIGSLVVMVFWGRFLAILWTSSWLFFIACWCYARGTAAAAAIKQVDECTLTTELRRRWTEEAEEKKRVVRRGLLERSRRI
ncbi:uncharacterized protein LOC103997813 [Musa acuminata AAA Group]|uniref:uncharacterized protein LOC103997813 n=1 Tax=Musa acuminata AAA Group TaxID=214697 RepID=UPI0031D91F89